MGAKAASRKLLTPISVAEGSEALVRALLKRTDVYRRDPALVRMSPSAYLGCDASADLAAVLTAFDMLDIRASIGAIDVWTEDPSPLPLADSPEAFYEWYEIEPSIVAALTNTLHLGCDRGGQVYFARLSPHGSEVFLYSPSLGELKFLSSSVSVFFELNQAMEAWTALEKAHRIDAEELLAGKVDLTRSGFAAIAEVIRRLAPQIDLSDRYSDVYSDFDEILTAIAGIVPKAKTRAPTQRAFEQSYWLLQALDGGSVDTSAAQERDLSKERADESWWGLAAVRVYWLWHFYLHGMDTELHALTEQVRQDPAALVRQTARMLESILPDTGSRPGVLGRFAGLRAVITRSNAGLEGEGDASRHLSPTPDDDQATSDLKTSLAADSGNVRRWDTLLYQYFQCQRFDDMEDAARVRLSISAGDYYPWLQLGISFQSRERYDEAIAAFNRTLVCRRYDGSTWMNLAMVYAKLGEQEQSLLLLAQAIRYRADCAEIARDAEEFIALRTHPRFVELTETSGQ